MADQSTSAHDHGVSEAHPAPTQNKRQLYVTIFLILGFLTFLELFVPSVYGATWSSTTKMLLLCIMAIVKAGLVAAYFMHLNHEAKWTRWIAYSPIYMGGAVIILMLESLYR
ncbi:MAG: cytochrome c oxidase subunit 4 [Planctomycetota bacterium]|jgi:cytochrome c oxidase subunit 4